MDRHRSLELNLYSSYKVKLDPTPGVHDELTLLTKLKHK